MTSEAFATGLPPAVTPPASIAARARARLSNRPRSTSSTSTRLRGELLLSLLSVNVSSIYLWRDPPQGERRPRRKQDRARYPQGSRAAAPLRHRADRARASSS